ncbi:hypothetical protein G6L94_31000 [Agrobacterium rhizogenes]|uniref:hypothetical protein n=1 Tax=Rhizobium rhizogenes TaxID=359 RepID=UPI00114679F9|nr:hypothetical protein [Rhizobium rhizogenes]NTI46650.1 hypothetical protein [Rhizobium rhizogenes]NTI52758.1 hypothetical protein [Rhizobium rhizogenes]NTI98131.1 hypothetical protein [Rhizobium rhizogenes]NTJ60554.1 hypothetical protein [Rhizobium rhizogenes]
MKWVANPKSLKTSTVTAHRDGRSHPIRGRAPAVREVTFTPSELYGAIARCSHLHVVDPSIVTEESEIYRNLISQHVAEENADFAILATADRLKDYSARHMTGVVGDGLAYLQMTRDGYDWFDHFENLPLLGSPATARSPDFVFSRRGDPTVAISESKATRGNSRERFNQTVSKAYVEQVSPYLGLTFGSSVASHGFAIGSYLTSNRRAELLIHHTATDEASDRVDEGSDPSAVRLGNYTNILSLLFGAEASRSFQLGLLPFRDRVFPSVRWLGRQWLIGVPSRLRKHLGEDFDELVWLSRRWLPWRATGWPRFALDLQIAKLAFRALERPAEAREALNSIPEMPSGLVDEARRSGGAIFPDGFAVLADDPTPESIVVRPIETGSEVAQVAAELQTQSVIVDQYDLSREPRIERVEEPQLMQIRITE